MVHMELPIHPVDRIDRIRDLRICVLHRVIPCIEIAIEATQYDRLHISREKIEIAHDELSRALRSH